MQLSTSKQEDIDSLLHWMRCDQLLKVSDLTSPQLWSVIRNFKWRWVPPHPTHPIAFSHHSDRKEARTSHTHRTGMGRKTPNGPVFPRETESAIKTLFSSNFRAHWLPRWIPPNNQCACSVCPLDTNKSRLRRGNLSWGMATTRRSCGHVHGAFSWLIIDVWGPSSLWWGHY